jgi:hypothetical protein
MIALSPVAFQAQVVSKNHGISFKILGCDPRIFARFLVQGKSAIHVALQIEIDAMHVTGLGREAVLVEKEINGGALQGCFFKKLFGRCLGNSFTVIHLASGKAPSAF